MFIFIFGSFARQVLWLNALGTKHGVSFLENFQAADVKDCNPLNAFIPFLNQAFTSSVAFAPSLAPATLSRP
jgi:hypothetical protein